MDSIIDDFGVAAWYYNYKDDVGGREVMSYTIGSINTLKMDYKSNDETHKSFKRIAEIIKREQFDVIALQEVMVESPPTCL